MDPNGEAFLLLARIHFDRGEHDEAIALATQARATGSCRARAELLLAYIGYELDRLDEAIAACARCVEADPKFVYGWLTYGDSWGCRIGRRGGKGYATALAMRPELSTAHRQIGKIQALRGETDRAVHSLELALRLEPMNGNAHLSLGDLFSALGQRDRAIEEYRACTRFNPTMISGNVRAGDLYLETDRMRDAAFEYKCAIENSKEDSARAHYVIGRVHLKPPA
jgi:tetratricopeptide (TPR) repeat protein